ncbi:MAG: type and secretion system protein [Xanthobacteraceae bacterium]|nr:type and secretion system protein [Xanthobacteraceae bacterium]
MKNSDLNSVASWGARQTDRNTNRAKDWRRTALRLTAIAGIAAAGWLLPAGIDQAQAQKLVQINGPKRTASVNVTVGKAEDIRLEAGFVDILVGDADVADVNPLTDRSLSILGKKIGTTRVSVYGEERKLLGIFDVEVSYDVTRLQTEIRRLTNSGIQVTSVNGRLLLSGTSPDAVTLDRAVTIARQFAPEVINTVSVRQQQQVMLEVRFVEASRQAGRELGVQINRYGNNSTMNSGNMAGASGLPVISSLTQAGAAAGVLSGTAPFGFAIARMVQGGMTADVIVNALEQKGLARSLAEPNLVALSGDTASFLAGGEFPVPVPGMNGSVAIEYKRYGVGLAFTPTVLKDGLINLKIDPEVSQLDTSNPVTVAGISVPPLIVRRASTTVELRDGQSFVIGGLLQNVGTSAQSQIPWLGDVPVLGTLFRSTQYQKNETDLCIIVTPRIVRPTRPGDIVKTPLDNTLPPNDADLFLMGKTEVARPDARLAAGGTRPLSGHMLDLPKGAPNVAIQ